VPPFWIRHDLFLKLFQFIFDVGQRRPTRIGRALYTSAGFDIQIFSASGAEAAAALVANDLHRKRQQYLLAQNVF
jgi:hypothetical protein